MAISIVFLAIVAVFCPVGFPSIRPNSYFIGIHEEFSPPQNVVLFARNSRQDLGPQISFCHSRYNLILSLAGSCEIIIDDRHFEISAESGFVTHPWQSFRFVFYEDTPLEWLFFAFELPTYHGRLPRNEVRRINPALYVSARRAVERHVQDGPGIWQVGFLRFFLDELSVMPAMETHPSSQLSANVSQILSIQRFVIRNCRRALTVGEVARNFFMSESRLRQIYREGTGVSIGSYIRGIRMNEAARQLIETDRPIFEIAEECSFSSLQVMSRAFAAYFGIAPGQYRKTGHHRIRSPETGP